MVFHRRKLTEPLVRKQYALHFNRAFAKIDHSPMLPEHPVIGRSNLVRCVNRASEGNLGQ